MENPTYSTYPSFKLHNILAFLDTCLVLCVRRLYAIVCRESSPTLGVRLSSARRLTLGEEPFAETSFTECTSLSVTLVKHFAECFPAFAECFRHTDIFLVFHRWNTSNHTSLIKLFLENNASALFSRWPWKIWSPTHSAPTLGTLQSYFFFLYMLKLMVLNNAL
jgi:hypothetical protein